MPARTGRSCVHCRTRSATGWLSTRWGPCGRWCSPLIRISCVSTRSRRATPPISPSLRAKILEVLAAPPTRRRSCRQCPISISPIRSRARPPSWPSVRPWRTLRTRRRRSRGHDRILLDLSLAADHHRGGITADADPPAHGHRLCALRRPQDLGGGAIAARPQCGRTLGAIPVSYTHLRAHETDSYLVCRLLLEK